MHKRCSAGKQQFLPRLIGVKLVLAVLSLWAAACAVSGDFNAPGSQIRLRKAILDEELSRNAVESSRVPGRSEAHYNFLLGEIALAKEQVDEALEYYEEAAEIETASSPTLRKRLAQLYVRKGRLEEGLEQVEMALSGGDDENLELLQLRAGILATLKRNKEAIDAYKKIVELGGPEDAHVFLASLYAQEDDVDSAEKILRILLKKSPNSFFGNYYLAKVLLVADKLEESEKYYRKSIELNPSSEGLQLELARVYARAGRFDDAIKICEAVNRRNPNNAKARTLLGELLLGKDKVSEALKEFQAAGALQEDPSEIRLKIALIKLRQRDLEGAEVELRLILTSHPENSPARYYLASAYAGMKRTDEALEQLAMIEPGQEFFEQSRTLAAYWLRDAKKYQEAIAMVEDLIEQKPEDVRYLTFLGSLQRDADDISGAIETTRKIIEIEPKADSHYFNLGVYLDELGQRSDALEAMRKAVELNPQNANALNYLGYTLAEDGTQLSEAEVMIKRALDIDTNNGYFIDSLGWVYYKMNRFSDAKRELERAVELVPNDAVILEHLGLVHWRLGDISKARKVMERALKYAPESDDKEAVNRIKKWLVELAVR